MGRYPINAPQHATSDRAPIRRRSTIKDGPGGVAIGGELRTLYVVWHEALEREMNAAGAPEPVPALHPSLSALYRRRVEALDEALDEALVASETALAAAAALRSLVDAVLVHTGERRGEVSLSLRGHLAAFLHAAGARAARGRAVVSGAQNGRTPVRCVANGGFVSGSGVLGSLDAGTRSHWQLPVSLQA